MPSRLTDSRTLGPIGPLVRNPRFPGIFMPVSFVLASRKVFPASYVDVGVTITGKDLAFSDLVISVSRPDDANDRTCLISASRARDDNIHSIRLLAGPRPGTYALIATHRTTGKVLGRASFRIDPTMALGDRGPSAWSKPTDGPGDIQLGGGDPGVQNVGAVRNLRNAKWRIAVALLDFNDTAFPAGPGDHAAAVKRWKDMLTDGAPGPAGVTSVASYYHESSYGLFQVEGDVFGPVAVAGNYTDFFPERTADADPSLGQFHIPDGDPAPAGATFYEATDPKDWQALISAVSDSIDLSTYDSVFFVPNNYVPAGEIYERFPWPQATLGQGGFLIPQTVGGTTMSVPKDIGCFVMPNNFDFVKPTLTTICHELGHNFGLTDLYKPGVQGDGKGVFRNVGGWDPMDYEGGLAHHCLAHKIMLGWVVDPAVTKPEDTDKIVRAIDFSVSKTGAETVKLAPAEKALPAGLHHGVEIRVSPNRSWYFEYRDMASGTVGDQQLPEVPSRVLGTDVQFVVDNEIDERPRILLLAGDPDLDSSVLALGEDFERTDLIEGDIPMALNVLVSDIKPDHAEITINYSVPARPNPSIRPWNTDPNNWWQSPDIEVRNDRTDADPAYHNMMWLGHQNRLIAKVTNTGGVDAPGVRVAFNLKDYTVGGAPESEPHYDVQDVPAGKTVEFTALVNPAAKDDAHYCVVVRIDPYQLPISKELESNVYDNNAQSNYTGVASIIASPPTRTRLSVKARNPFNHPTRVHIEPSQSRDAFIGYVEHRWLRLGAGQLADVLVETEFAPASAVQMQHSDYMAKAGPTIQRIQRMHGRMAVGAYAEWPDDKHPYAMAGVDITLLAGFHTRIGALRITGDTVSGSVMRIAMEQPPQPVSGGVVLLTMPGQHNQELVVRAQCDAKGHFAFGKLSPTKRGAFTLHYLGFHHDAPSEIMGHFD